MPGVGVRAGARILIEVGDGSTFPTAGHLAAYTGLAPATRSSGSSIRGEQPSRRETSSSYGPCSSPRSPP
ncbi:IS110 family transposase [Streptomyces sp. NPDC016675]|uniref:IS110 family transposase n=1 Tax=Streptomyces sp. NPDC016675 TaxID=3364970 RepID=UPI0036FC20F5